MRLTPMLMRGCTTTLVGPAVKDPLPFGSGEGQVPPGGRRKIHEVNPAFARSWIIRTVLRWPDPCRIIKPVRIGIL